ncbi:MAG: serine protein kinase RIO, partial [Methanobacteriota archaeon]
MSMLTNNKDRRIEQLVFDNRSLYALNRAIKKGIIESVEFPISTGKEANVYRAKT